MPRMPTVRMPAANITSISEMPEREGSLIVRLMLTTSYALQFDRQFAQFHQLDVRAEARHAAWPDP